MIDSLCEDGFLRLYFGFKSGSVALIEATAKQTCDRGSLIHVDTVELWRPQGIGHETTLDQSLCHPETTVLIDFGLPNQDQTRQRCHCRLRSPKTR